MKMKSVLLAALSVALLCLFMLPVSVAASSENLASNGDFETGDTSGWDVKVGQVVDAEAYEGRYSLFLTAKNEWQEAALKTVPVLKNATVTVSFYYNIVYGEGAYHVFTYQGANTAVGNYTNGADAPLSSHEQWTKVTYTFNSGNFDHITLKFCPRADYDYVVCAVDNLVVTMEGGDIPVDVDPYLTSFGTKQNRPKDAASNLIANGGFESTANAPWNTTSFIKGNLRVVEDATAPEGSHSLFFDSTSATRHTFTVAVEPATNYTFSAWVKSPRLSGSNRATATFGVMDAATGYFLVYEPYRGNGHGAALLSDKTMQLMATAPDDAWHLRSVTFYSGSATTVQIGVCGADSQLYLDDIALFKNVHAVEYFSPLRTEELHSSDRENALYCADEDSLIEGIYMTSNDAQTYWSDNPAWRNGFLSFAEDDATHGTVLKYSRSAHPEWKLHYIKWIDVKPHTDYTFTCEVKILEEGDGYIGLMDDNVVSPAVFARYFDWYVGEEWNTYSTTFSSGAYSRIGIVIVDGGGSFLVDEVRLFETTKGIATAPAEGQPTLKPIGGHTSTMEMSSGETPLTNGDFEEGSPAGWDIYQQTVLSAEATYGGSYGAHLKGNGSWGAMLEQGNIPVADGKTYTLSFWYKANQNGANVTLKGSTTATQYAYEWVGNTAWTHVTRTFTVEGDTSLVLNLCGGGNGVAEDIYVDNFRLIPEDSTALLGIAFLTEMKGNRIYMDARHRVNLSTATVNPYEDERAYRLLRMGALMTNQAAIGNDSSAMILSNVNNDTVANVPIEYLWSVSDAGCQFAVRVVNVPLTHTTTQIYARPYYVFEKDGEEIVVYGDIVSRSYDG